ncbi:MAG: peroxiredoxin [Methanomassiliicoccales archaeon]
MAELEVGQRAPDFELLDQEGKSFRLSEELRHSPVILYFYPKDFTPGCTAEACEFRDNFQKVSEVGYALVGISSDSVETHSEFAKKYGLQFRLLSDRDGRVRELFGVKRTLGLLPGRTTFVIGQDGTVLRKFSSQFKPREHPYRALDLTKNSQ